MRISPSKHRRGKPNSGEEIVVLEVQALGRSTIRCIIDLFCRRLLANQVCESRNRHERRGDLRERDEGVEGERREDKLGGGRV